MPPLPWDQLPLVLQRPAVRWSWREFLGYMLGAGAFGVFFGGSLLDGVASGVIGGVIYLMEQVRPAPPAEQGDLHHGGLLPLRDPGPAVCCHRVWHQFGPDYDWGHHAFHPGAGDCQRVREFFYADILTGVYRLIEALLIAGAIAVGYAVSLVIGGQIL